MAPLSLSSPDLRSTLRITGIVLITVLVIGYMYFQARNLINGPSIQLSHEPTSVNHERSVVIQGTARNITELTLNGREIFTDEAGNFEHSLILENGYTIMTMRAEDRFGRSTTLTRTFVYQPEVL